MLYSMESKNLILRNWVRTDFQEYMAIVSDPEVMLPAGGRPLENVDDARFEFTKVLLDSDSFAIVYKKTDRPIGKIVFQKDIRRYKVKSVSIGYELMKRYWGMGLMSEALKAMVNFAFMKKKVEVVGIAHFTANSRSRRVIEKCGFKHEGTLPKAFKRFDGEIFDDESYSIVKEDYFRFLKNIQNPY